MDTIYSPEPYMTEALRIHTHTHMHVGRDYQIVFKLQRVRTKGGASLLGPATER